MRYFWPISIMLVIVIMAGCQSPATQKLNPTSNQPTAMSTQSGQQGYPAPGQTPGIGNGYPAAPGTSAASTGYPSQATPELKSITAFQAYQIALPYALKWNPKSVLYLIPATYQQQIDFGQSSEPEGWFFMFKEPGNPLEYYIYITEGVFGGAKEAQPIFMGTPAPYNFLPLPDISKMIDSDKFIDLYKQNGGNNYLSENSKAILNPQLSYQRGDQYPIWRMFDASKIKDSIVLLSVNALTGEVVNPQ